MAEADGVEQATGLGAMLRRAREARGLTELQAAEQLNLDRSVVDALERDDLAALGAPVFAKGHLRRYGALLGLAEDELLAAYEHASVQPVVPSLIPRARLEMAPARSRPTKWPKVLGGVLALLLAAGLVALVSEVVLPWIGGDAADSAVETPAGPTAAPGSPVAGDGPPGASAPAGAASGADAGFAAVASDVTPPPVPPGHVSLTMAYAADSWTEIYDGAGTAVLYDLGRAGTRRTIAAAAPLSVTFGNAPAVTLAVNGRAVVLPAVPAGQTVARFTVAADGTLR